MCLSLVDDKGSGVASGSGADRPDDKYSPLSVKYLGEQCCAELCVVFLSVHIGQCILEGQVVSSLTCVRVGVGALYTGFLIER